MAKTISYFRQKGDPQILLTALGLVLSLGMVIFMIVIILVKGLGFFWPSDLIEVRLKNDKTYLGEQWQETTAYLTAADGKTIPEKQIQLKIGNRDLYGRDFIWINESDIAQSGFPEYATTFERTEYGNFYGRIKSLHTPDGEVTATGEALFLKSRQMHRIAWKNKQAIKELEDEVNKLQTPMNKIHREISLLEISPDARTPAGKARLEALEKKADNLERDIAPHFQVLNQELQKRYRSDRELYLTVQAAGGEVKTVPLSKIVRFYQPNRMSGLSKAGLYTAKLWEFVSADPRESNTEGGVFPAIFGTVMMVLLMSIAVVPFGVLAAIYLNEYARQGAVIRLIRLSVNNLAGVPSIVYGIFGLGFFIYIIGGSIDQLFFSSKLPQPTFGTGGILWASLTLALLTLPVVVVATEEGILSVPRANKEGSLALGSTRWQMIRKIVLPNAMPGILTGLILAISRGAGEVAPLMITGVVKLAPTLPLDGTFPFLHLDRKFMHLGFHIYDVGFQSPNVEAAKPMVYTTALLLILIVIVLNLFAIYLRNRLRKKFKTTAF